MKISSSCRLATWWTYLDRKLLNRHDEIFRNKRSHLLSSRHAENFSKICHPLFRTRLVLGDVHRLVFASILYLWQVGFHVVPRLRFIDFASFVWPSFASFHDLLDFSWLLLLLKFFMISVILFKMGKQWFSSQLLSNSKCMTGFYSCHKTDEFKSLYGFGGRCLKIR